MGDASSFVRTVHSPPPRPAKRRLVFPPTSVDMTETVAAPFATRRLGDSTAGATAVALGAAGDVLCGLSASSCALEGAGDAGRGDHLDAAGSHAMPGSGALGRPAAHQNGESRSPARLDLAVALPAVMSLLSTLAPANGAAAPAARAPADPLSTLPHAGDLGASSGAHDGAGRGARLDADGDNAMA